MAHNSVYRAIGVTESERYLQRLCNRSFLSLWIYSGVFRDQGRKDSKGDGKELCDLLVVFENHVIIFSDKYCEFPNTGDLTLDWSRWFRRAVQKGADQVYGAERWIRDNPDRLYLDRTCTRPFPIDFPNPANTTFHRIVVAHGASERCKQEIGGSGSLIINSLLVGNMHFLSQQDGGLPFAVGSIDGGKGYVHVLDDTSLDIVLNTLDTVTDFVRYLAKKERLTASNHPVLAAGEENLLALYLRDVNSENEHDFMVPDDDSPIIVADGIWNDFAKNPQRQAQMRADEISYTWDALTERFNTALIEGTQYYFTHSEVRDTERLHRFLAREPRMRRRMLSDSLIELIENTNDRSVRVIEPSRMNDPHYVFLILRQSKDLAYELYRDVRLKLLQAYCMVAKLRYPTAVDIVGIATEPGIDNPMRSEDVLYLDANIWTAEDAAEAERIQSEFSLLIDIKKSQSVVHEYPEIDIQNGNLTKVPKNPRNKPCPCGSGKKYKHCCLKRDRKRAGF